MGIYQKRPVVIEAKQWRASNPTEITEWLDANNFEYAVVENRIHVGTHYVAHDGDMIINLNPGFKVVRLDVFAEQYESVRE